MNWTPMHIASSVGQVDIVSALMSKGAPVNAVNQTGQTPLHYAASRNRLEVGEHCHQFQNLALCQRRNFIGQWLGATMPLLEVHRTVFVTQPFGIYSICWQYFMYFFLDYKYIKSLMCILCLYCFYTEQHTAVKKQEDNLHPLLTCHNAVNAGEALVTTLMYT